MKPAAGDQSGRKDPQPPLNSAVSPAPLPFQDATFSPVFKNFESRKKAANDRRFLQF